MRLRQLFTAVAVSTLLVTAAGCAAEDQPVSNKVQEYYDANKSLASGMPAAKAVSVSLISDSHAYNAGSWWRQTIGGNAVKGTSVGDTQSFPGADSESIQRQLTVVDYADDYVVVQAGTNDLRAGDDAATTAEGVKSLVALVIERKGKPVLALIPPSDEKPAVAKEANEILMLWADTQGIPMIDVYTPVAAPDGSWLPGLSGDKIHANADGSARMVQAATAAAGTIFTE